MSSDFSISEFRRRRASDNPPPPETGQLPLEMPLSDLTGPQEFVPQMTRSIIPDAVPNTHLQNSIPPNTYAQPNVQGQPVNPPVLHQHATAPPPMPMAAIAPATAPMAKAATVAKAEKPKSKSLVGGLLGRLKKSPAAQAEVNPVPEGPVEFAPMSAANPQQPGGAQFEPIHQSPAQSPRLRAAIPAKSTAMDMMPTVKIKTGVPTWASFMLGTMAGIILTFAGLALLSGSDGNSLEARFSEAEKSIQSADISTPNVTAEEQTLDVVEAPEAPRDDI